MKHFLDELRELTNKLPSLSDMVMKQDNGIIEYKVLNGKAVAKNIYHAPEISIQMCFIDKGTIFPAHHHSVREFVLVLKGKAKMENQFGSKEYEVNDYFVNEAEEPHNFIAIEECVVVGIQLPTNGGYPMDGDIENGG